MTSGLWFGCLGIGAIDQDGEGKFKVMFRQVIIESLWVLGWQYPGEHRALGIISAGQREKQGLWVRLFGEKFRIREEY